MDREMANSPLGSAVAEDGAKPGGDAVKDESPTLGKLEEEEQKDPLIETEGELYDQKVAVER